MRPEQVPPRLVSRWTGREARALRQALRLSVRDFAAHLGVSASSVSALERRGPQARPRTFTQQLLDIALNQAPDQTKDVFHDLLEQGRDERSTAATGPIDLDAWADDLDRATASLTAQDHRSTDALLQQWLAVPPEALDPRGLELRGRSLMTRGNLLRYQGVVTGPHSAIQFYRAATDVFTHLDKPRRLAQVDLARTIAIEMSGDVLVAARAYEALAEDERLRPYERAQARLWIGTALTKAREPIVAIPMIEDACRELERLGEHQDWAVGRQKKALAELAAGNITSAIASIDEALRYRRSELPLERVRLATAQGHVLLADRRTRDEAMDILEEAFVDAHRYGLAHQVRWIERIQRRARKGTT